MKAFVPPARKASCPNCHPECSFCPECGEKRSDRKDLSFRNFAADLLNEVTELDSKFLRTLWLLTFRPGFLSEEFSKGVQVPYIKPFRLFLIIAVIHFLAFGLSHSADIYQVGGIMSQVAQFETITQLKLIKPHIATAYDVSAANKSIKDILSGLVYVILFIVAGFYYALFRHRRAYYSEHLVFFVHIVSAAFLRNFLLLPVLILSRPVGMTMVMGLNIVYVVAAIKRFYFLPPGRSVLMIIPTMLLVGTFMASFWVLAALFVLWR